MVNLREAASKLATVVKVIDEYTLVINRGSENGVKIGDKFLIFTIDNEEIIDPETRESLGRLEIVRGTGSVSHVQEKLATIRSNRTHQRPRTIRKAASPWMSMLAASEIIEESGTEVAPFVAPSLNDKAKSI